jgi:hypothetical protein
MSYPPDEPQDPGRPDRPGDQQQQPGQPHDQGQPDRPDDQEQPSQPQYSYGPQPGVGRSGCVIAIVLGSVILLVIVGVVLGLTLGLRHSPSPRHSTGSATFPAPSSATWLGANRSALRRDAS